MCVETADPRPAPHPLSPRFRDQMIARRWLGDYLRYSADNLNRDGDHDQATAFRAAITPVRADGHSDVGTVHHRVLSASAW